MFFHMKTLAARNTFIIDPDGHIAQGLLESRAPASQQ